MLPIVISLSIALLGLATAAVLVWIATRGREEEPEPEEPARTPSPPGQFFLDEGAEYMARFTPSPDAFRDRLERYVRREHDAAKAFLDALNAESQVNSGSKPKQRK
jgi:hypothetical protein